MFLGYLSGSFLRILIDLDFYSAILGFLFIVFYKPKLKRFIPIVWFIIFQVVILFCINLTQVYLRGRSNIYLYQIDAFVSLLFIEAYFVYILKVYNKKLLKTLLMLLTVFIFLFMAFVEDRKQLNSYSYGIVSLLITFFCFGYYAKLLNNPDTTVIYKVPEFWIVTGILLYYSLCMFIFLPYKTLTKLNYKFVQNHFFDLWIFQNCIYFIMIIAFIKGFTCKKYLKTP